MRHSMIGRVDDQSFDVPDLAIARANSVSAMDIHLPEGNGLLGDDLRRSEGRSERRPRTRSVPDEVPQAAVFRNSVFLLSGIERAEFVDRAAKTHTAAPSCCFHESDGRETVEDAPMLHTHNQVRHRPSPRINDHALHLSAHGPTAAPHLSADHEILSIGQTNIS
jgi:hypothetical protein